MGQDEKETQCKFKEMHLKEHEKLYLRPRVGDES